MGNENSVCVCVCVSPSSLALLHLLFLYMCGGGWQQNYCAEYYRAQCVRMGAAALVWGLLWYGRCSGVGAALVWALLWYGGCSGVSVMGAALGCFFLLVHFCTYTNLALFCRYTDCL